MAKFAAAKYVFLTCIVPVVEIEGSASFVSFFSQLTLGLLNLCCNSLVCLAVLILEIIPQKTAS